MPLKTTAFSWGSEHAAMELQLNVDIREKSQTVQNIVFDTVVILFVAKNNSSY